MPAPTVHQHVFPNGLVLLGEPMPGVQSAAFTLMMPAGAAAERPDRGGSASMLAEWIMRGAGPRDSRELLNVLDNLGIMHSQGAQTIHATLAAATLGRNIVPALGLFADVVRRPALIDEEVEPIRALALQGLQSLEDDPGSKVMEELRRRHFPSPWGRSTSGTPEGVEAATPDDLRALFTAGYRPNGAILAVAGAINWPALRDAVGDLFGDWEPRPEHVTAPAPGGPRRDHILKETQQTQIAMAFPGVPITDPDYYLARAATAILGGYSSSRLFTEVREKRGLCYTVYAGYESFRDRAAVLCYAGTAPERAQQTLDVMRDEIRRLGRSGIEAEELDTMRAGLKSALIMQQESSIGRSGSLASDWYLLGRVRPLEEITGAFDALTPESVGAFAAAQDVDDPTIVTLGPTALSFGD